MTNRFENPIEDVRPPDPWEEEEIAKEAKENPDLKLSKKSKYKLKDAFEKQKRQSN